jgi:hypothetical protein
MCSHCSGDYQNPDATTNAPLAPRELIRDWERSIAELAQNLVYHYPHAISGDVLAVTRAIEEAVARRLESIAARTSKPEEH